MIAMARFVYFFRGGAAERPDLSPTEMQAHVKKWYAWAETLSKSGHLVGSGLPVDSGGKTIRGRDRVVTDGPYAESKDLVTGSMAINAASLEQAVELAHGCPVFDYGGSVEVRPVVDHDL